MELRELARTATQIAGPLARPSALALPKVTRAHLLLSQYPQLAETAAELLSHVAASLAPPLDSDVSVQARLLAWAKRPPAQFPATSCVASVDLSLCEEPMLIELDLDFAVSLVSRLAGDAPKPGPVTALTRLEEAAFGYLLLVAVRSVRSLPGWPGALAPRLSALNSRGSAIVPRGPFAVVEIELGVGAHRGQLRCWVPSEALQRAWEKLESPATPELNATLGALDLPVRAALAATQIDAAELRLLAPRDVILLGARAFEVPGRIWTPAFELTGTFIGQGFALTSLNTPLSTPPHLEITMTETVLKSPGSTSAEPLRVELEVELTRKRLTLAQLAALAPGAILPLQLSISEPVILRVGDRVIGTAELVEVEGEVGARILKLVR